jgi:hypothetical protein
MAWKYNPFTRTFDRTGSGGASYINGTVANPSLLPVTLGSPALDAVYLAKAASGVWFINRKSAGLYCRTANDGALTDWTYLGAFPEVNSDANWRLYSEASTENQLAFSLSELSGGETKTLTVPDRSGRIVLDETIGDIEFMGTENGFILRNEIGERVRFTMGNDRELVRTLLPLLILLGFAVSSPAQIARDLGLDASNRVVTGITSGNPVTFTNPLAFGTNAATTISNLFIGNEAIARQVLIIGEGDVVRFADVAATTFLAGNATNYVYGSENGLNFYGTTAATTRTNLGLGSLATNNSVPSGALPAGIPLLTDGAGGSVFPSQREWLVRQTTNGPVVTNGLTTSSLVISNVPAGLYWIQGHIDSTANATRLWQFIAAHQVLNPRNLLVWFGTGSASGFFNSATNMHNNADAATGVRPAAINGPLLFTNTTTVSFNISVTGATNTAQVLSNSFLFLRKLD